MSHRDVLHVIRCRNTRRMAELALAAGWEWVGYTRSGHIELRWPATGAVLHCATTPSDSNAWKQFARNVKRLSGVEIWRPSSRGRGHAHSNRREVEQGRAMARRRDSLLDRQRRREQAERDEARRRREAADRSGRDDRRCRDIEDLMRPGFGH